jgi:hypothetical protein
MATNCQDSTEAEPSGNQRFDVTGHALVEGDILVVASGLEDAVQFQHTGLVLNSEAGPIAEFTQYNGIGRIGETAIFATRRQVEAVIASGGRLIDEGNNALVERYTTPGSEETFAENLPTAIGNARLAHVNIDEDGESNSSVVYKEGSLWYIARYHSELERFELERRRNVTGFGEPKSQLIEDISSSVAEDATITAGLRYLIDEELPDAVSHPESYE